MDEKWISSNLMTYLIHMANLNKVEGVNFLRIAIEYIRANPYMIAILKGSTLLNAYNTNKVVVPRHHNRVDNL